MNTLPPFRRYETLAGVEYEMLSSKGNCYYTVPLVSGNATGCECKHAEFNPSCKHQREAERLEKAYQQENKPQPTAEEEKREYAPLNGHRGFSLYR